MGETKISKISLGQVADDGDMPSFRLSDFFPYHVRLFYQAVSSSVASVYGAAHELTASEWRVMVVLGPEGAMSANEITQKSSMSKVNVSRAVARLRKRDFLSQMVDGADRRRSVLRLTMAGRAAFASMVPQVLAIEEKLLDGLTQDEIRTLESLMAKIRANAEKSGPLPDLPD